MVHYLRNKMNKQSIRPGERWVRSKRRHLFCMCYLSLFLHPPRKIIKLCQWSIMLAIRCYYVPLIDGQLVLSAWCDTVGQEAEEDGLYLQRLPAAEGSPCSSPSRPAGSPLRWLWHRATAVQVGRRHKPMEKKTGIGTDRRKWRGRDGQWKRQDLIQL